MRSRRRGSGPDRSGTILLVDDDVQLRGILRANFEVVGYDVVDARDGDAAIAALDRARPDAIVVDVLPAASDGPAFVRRVRLHPQGGSVPLIVLTARAQAGDAVRALEAGADDVVVKPFAPEEMLARVRGKIKRTADDAALQPLTKLPGNGPIEREIRRRLASGEPWSVLYLDLDGFKAFNDAFGFAAGDEVIRLLARTLLDAVRAHGSPDDFVAVMRPARAVQIGEAVAGAFDRAIRTLQHDLRVPYCTVSIAVLAGARGSATYERIGERAARVKKEAKRRRGSAVVSESDLPRGGGSAFPFAALAYGAVLGAALLFGTGAADAKSRVDAKIEAQRAKIHAVHQKLNAERSRLQDARSRVGTIQTQLADTNRNIGSVNGRLEELQARMKSTERKLAWNRVQLDAAQQTLKRHQAALNRRLVDAYEHGDLGYVDVLLRARSFADFVERWNDIRFLIKANESTIRARQRDKAKVVTIQAGLVGAQTELRNQTAQVQQQRQALDVLARQRSQLLAAADAERQHVQNEVIALDEESAASEAALEALIRQKQAEEEARRQALRRARQLAGEELPAEVHVGQLSWPASGPITSPFGMRVNPVTHVFTQHKGIDIAVVSGTTVSAAAEGRVIVAGWDDGGCGNMVVIDHGSRLATQYCHLSQVFVGVGQDVQRGQAIAASGSTGNSTGPHLHFGVRVDGRAVDPMSYLH